MGYPKNLTTDIVFEKLKPPFSITPEELLGPYLFIPGNCRHCHPFLLAWQLHLRLQVLAILIQQFGKIQKKYIINWKKPTNWQSSQYSTDFLNLHMFLFSPNLIFKTTTKIFRTNIMERKDYWAEACLGLPNSKAIVATKLLFLTPVVRHFSKGWPLKAK